MLKLKISSKFGNFFVIKKQLYPQEKFSQLPPPPLLMITDQTTWPLSPSIIAEMELRRNRLFVLCNFTTRPLQVSYVLKIVVRRITIHSSLMICVKDISYNYVLCLLRHLFSLQESIRFSSSRPSSCFTLLDRFGTL